MLGGRQVRASIKNREEQVDEIKLGEVLLKKSGEFEENCVQDRFQLFF